MKLILLLFCLNAVFAKLDINWWRSTSVYNVIIPVFKDSNGDGIGDIRGIISKIDHFVDLGVETICLSSFLKKSSTDENIYDIIDHKSIDPRFGTLEDFEELVNKLKSKGIKVLINMVINHTSNKHEWFLKSEDNVEQYRDYYIWQNPKGFDKYSDSFILPTDWHDAKYEPTWIYSNKRKQFYYHSSFPELPDLNLRNENVKKQLQDIIIFWLNKGIAGFNLDCPDFYIENFHELEGQENQKESLQFVREIRSFLNDYNKHHGEFERIIVIENKSIFWPLSYYVSKQFPLYHFVYFIPSRLFMRSIDAPNINVAVQLFVKDIPEGEVSAWMIDNESFKRMSLEMVEMNDIFTMLSSILPGVTNYHYGQEIALLSGLLERSEEKTLNFNPPMSWDESMNSGFTKNLKPFLPLVEDFPIRNVKNQKQADISHYNLLKDLLALRKTRTLKHGQFRSFVYSRNVYTIWRSLLGHPTYILLINTLDAESKIDLKKLFKNPPRTFSVEAVSVNGGFKKGQLIGDSEDFNIIMKPMSSIIISAEKYL